MKSVIVPTRRQNATRARTWHRTLENFNLVFTIKSEPLTGVGFGRPFYQPAPLPDISFFVFYRVHPSQLAAVGLAQDGLLRLRHPALRHRRHPACRDACLCLTLPTGTTLAVTTAAVSYIVMYFVFAYVDIVWDTREHTLRRGVYGHLHQHQPSRQRAEAASAGRAPAAPAPVAVTEVRPSQPIAVPQPA